MDARSMEALLKDMSGRKGGGSSTFDMTKEEEERLSSALQTEEFRDMLLDYMKEISDPATRAEREAYIEQMEGRGEVPGGMRLVKPEPGFAVKTHMVRGEGSSAASSAAGGGVKPALAAAGGKSASGASVPTSVAASAASAAAGGSDKVFVNIVTSADVDAPSMTPAPSGGGASVSIPHLTSPLRYEHDAKAVPVPTFDVCVHPAALSQAYGSERYRRLLCEVAIEGAELALRAAGKRAADASGSSGSGGAAAAAAGAAGGSSGMAVVPAGAATVVLDRRFHVLKNTRCVGGKPAILNVSATSAGLSKAAAASSGAATPAGASAASSSPASTTAAAAGRSGAAAPSKAASKPAGASGAAAPVKAAPVAAAAPAQHATVVKGGARGAALAASGGAPSASVSLPGSAAAAGADLGMREAATRRVAAAPSAASAAPDRIPTSFAEEPAEGEEGEGQADGSGAGTDRASSGSVTAVGSGSAAGAARKGAPLRVGLLQPRVEAVHRGVVDISEHLHLTGSSGSVSDSSGSGSSGAAEAGGSSAGRSGTIVTAVGSRPKELVLRIHLPLLPGAASIEHCDIEEERVVLRSARLPYRLLPAGGVGGGVGSSGSFAAVSDAETAAAAAAGCSTCRYQLEYRLPYPVDHDAMAHLPAKFDRDRRVLTLTIPILKHAPLRPQQTAPGQPGHAAAAGAASQASIGNGNGSPLPPVSQLVHPLPAPAGTLAAEVAPLAVPLPRPVVHGEGGAVLLPSDIPSSPAAQPPQAAGQGAGEGEEALAAGAATDGSLGRAAAAEAALLAVGADGAQGAAGSATGASSAKGPAKPTPAPAQAHSRWVKDRVVAVNPPPVPAAAAVPAPAADAAPSTASSPTAEAAAAISSNSAVSAPAAGAASEKSLAAPASSSLAAAAPAAAAATTTAATAAAPAPRVLLGGEAPFRWRQDETHVILLVDVPHCRQPSLKLRWRRSRELVAAQGPAAATAAAPGGAGAKGAAAGTQAPSRHQQPQQDAADGLAIEFDAAVAPMDAAAYARAIAAGSDLAQPLQRTDSETYVADPRFYPEHQRDDAAGGEGEGGAAAGGASSASVAPATAGGAACGMRGPLLFSYYLDLPRLHAPILPSACEVDVSDGNIAIVLRKAGGQRPAPAAASSVGTRAAGTAAGPAPSPATGSSLFDRTGDKGGWPSLIHASLLDAAQDRDVEEEENEEEKDKRGESARAAITSSGSGPSLAAGEQKPAAAAAGAGAAVAPAPAGSAKASAPAPLSAVAPAADANASGTGAATTAAEPHSPAGSASQPLLPPGELAALLGAEAAAAIPAPVPLPAFLLPLKRAVQERSARQPPLFTFPPLPGIEGLAIAADGAAALAPTPDAASPGLAAAAAGGAGAAAGAPSSAHAGAGKSAAGGAGSKGPQPASSADHTAAWAGVAAASPFLIAPGSVPAEQLRQGLVAGRYLQGRTGAVYDAHTLYRAFDKHVLDLPQQGLPPYPEDPPGFAAPATPATGKPGAGSGGAGVDAAGRGAAAGAAAGRSHSQAVEL